MSNFINNLKSFVHSLSTYDHYATYDPTKPAQQEDTRPLTTAHANSPRTSASEEGAGGYTPGMRSLQLGAAGASDSTDANGSQDHIPLTEMLPIPAPDLSWARIDEWIEANYPELWDQLQEPVTENDLNDLEHDLDCVLPQDVRESYYVHDGQEQGGKPTGVFFGITLLDIEGISEEWNIWRRAAIKLESMAHKQKMANTPATAGTSKPSNSGANSPQSGPSAQAAAGQPRNLAWIENQDSCPPEAVKPVYAHPGWIPLAKDFNGNNIAVDLSPGPKGRVGQVILFGRDFDTKYVVSPSWGDFLAQFAADLESGNSYIDDDIEDAVFAFKNPNGSLVSYFSVLKYRVQRTVPQKPKPRPQPSQHAAAGPSHKPNSPTNPRINVSVSQAPVNSGRVTQRLTSPSSQFRAPSGSRNSSRNGSRKNSRAGLKDKDLNEVDLAQPAKVRSPVTQLKEVDISASPNSEVDSEAVSPTSSKVDLKSNVEEEPAQTDLPEIKEPKESEESEQIVIDHEPESEESNENKEANTPEEPEKSEKSEEPENSENSENLEKSESTESVESTETSTPENKDQDSSKKHSVKFDESV